MKVNFDKQFKDINGKDLKGDTIAHAIAEALFYYGKDKPVKRDEKFRAYCLCKKIIEGHGVVEIQTEEACLIKEVCGEVLTAGGYGQIHDIIEND